MVKEAVLEGHVMAKRAGILVESGSFHPSLGSNNKAFVQRSHFG
jgi:hypothetical protein